MRTKLSTLRRTLPLIVLAGFVVTACGSDRDNNKRTKKDAPQEEPSQDDPEPTPTWLSVGALYQAEVGGDVSRSASEELGILVTTLAFDAKDPAPWLFAPGLDEFQPNFDDAVWFVNPSTPDHGCPMRADEDSTGHDVTWTPKEDGGMRIEITAYDVPTLDGAETEACRQLLWGASPADITLRANEASGRHEGEIKTVPSMYLMLDKPEQD